MSRNSHGTDIKGSGLHLHVCLVSGFRWVATPSFL
jgi:hypothetical protein